MVPAGGSYGNPGDPMLVFRLAGENGDPMQGESGASSGSVILK